MAHVSGSLLGDIVVPKGKKDYIFGVEYLIGRMQS